MPLCLCVVWLTYTFGNAGRCEMIPALPHPLIFTIPVWFLGSHVVVESFAILWPNICPVEYKPTWLIIYLLPFIYCVVLFYGVYDREVKAQRRVEAERLRHERAACFVNP